MIKEVGKYYWSGPSGWVMHVTNKAKTIKRARILIHEIIKDIIIPQKYFRTDIGMKGLSKQ